MSMSSMTRRTILKTAALAPPAVCRNLARCAFCSGAYAAASCRWEPGTPLGSWRERRPKKICMEWAEKEKVELVVDLITPTATRICSRLWPKGRRKPAMTSWACAPGT